MKGKVVKLNDVADAAFASGMLGQGVAIAPEEGILYAPIDGKVSALFPTGHAIGITSETGAEMLIHVGMDTVQLQGKGFTPLVAVGDSIKQGQKLLEFDMNLIQEAGYSLVTPILITNSDTFTDIVPTEDTEVQVGSVLITVS